MDIPTMNSSNLETINKVCTKNTKCTQSQVTNADWTLIYHMHGSFLWSTLPVAVTQAHFCCSQYSVLQIQCLLRSHTRFQSVILSAESLHTSAVNHVCYWWNNDVDLFVYKDTSSRLLLFVGGAGESIFLFIFMQLVHWFAGGHWGHSRGEPGEEGGKAYSQYGCVRMALRGEGRMCRMDQAQTLRHSTRIIPVVVAEWYNSIVQ